MRARINDRSTRLYEYYINQILLEDKQE